MREGLTPTGKEGRRPQGAVLLGVLALVHAPLDTQDLRTRKGASYCASILLWLLKIVIIVP